MLQVIFHRMSVNSVESGTPDRPWWDAVAAEVRAEMGRQRLSIRQLAKMAGLSPATATRRINGDSPFALDELAKVARALRRPVSQFLLPGSLPPNTGWKSSRIRSIISRLRWSRPSLALAG